MAKYSAKLPKLHEAQETVAKSEARWKILCAGRRFVKTILGVQLCMQAALEGKRAWWVAPTFAIARVGWRAIEAAAMSFPLEIRPKVSLANMEVTFENGGYIAAKSADNPQRLRGEGLDFIVIDEAAFVKPEVWQEVLRPTLTERKGGALSTIILLVINADDHRITKIIGIKNATLVHHVICVRNPAVFGFFHFLLFFLPWCKTPAD